VQDDLATILMERHALLVWLAWKAAQSPDSDTRVVWVGHLVTALGGHLRSVEEEICPALDRALPHGVPDPALVAYKATAAGLAELVLAGQHAPDFHEWLGKVKSTIHAMCTMERQFVIPALHATLDAPARSLVAFGLEREFDDYVGTHAVDKVRR